MRLQPRAFAVFCLIGGCSDSAGGPEYASLAVQVQNTNGEATTRHCAVLPVLPGGRVEQELRVGGAFVITLDGTRDEIELTFDGVADADTARRHYTHADLRARVSDAYPVATSRGEEFFVLLTAPCPAD